MMRFFNALQLTATFAAAPFGIWYLASYPFPCQTVVLLIVSVIYLIGFGMMTFIVADSIRVSSRR